MKYISCFLLAILFCAKAICIAELTPLCDPEKKCNKPADTTAVKKAPLKNNPSPAAQQPKKQTAQKEEKKSGGDLISPLSWRPSFIY
jgi:hypothetical protein